MEMEYTNKLFIGRLKPRHFYELEPKNFKAIIELQEANKKFDIEEYGGYIDL
jgi:hypothetical protein